MWTDVLSWALPVAIAVIVVAVSLHSIRKNRGKKKNFTERTIGILRGAQNTGLYVNEQPELLLRFEALQEDGRTEPVQVKQIVPMTELSKLREGSLFPIRYDPESKLGVVDTAPVADDALQERFEHFASLRNPRGFTSEQRALLRTKGVRYRAMLTDLRLTGEEENGCSEVRLTIRIDGKGGERVLSRTAWMEDKCIENLTVGKLVNVSVVEGEGEAPPLFSIDQDSNAVLY